MGKMPGQQSSFEEAVEGLYTDSGLDGELRKRTTGFSAELESRLQELEQEVTKVDERAGPANVINDPVMSRVRELAAIAVKLLQDELK